MSAISNEVDVSLKTIQSWKGILENSFIIYLLKPYYQNYNKTMTKRPKVYFYDVGLISSYLRITNTSQLENQPLKSSIFENMVVIELVIKFTNIGINQPLYYWRDKTGHEIDVIVNYKGKTTHIAIKSRKTINTDFNKHLKYWNKISKNDHKLILNSGDQEQQRSDGTKVTNWQNINSLEF